MALSSAEQGMQCVIHWFTYWSDLQKTDFLQDLVAKAVPLKVSTLLDAMTSLNVSRKKPPSIFECQMKLFDQWFEEWTDKERNTLMQQLEQIDSDFVARFNEEVAATS
ncbi:hypothetical protein LSAT2_023160, partial [Lamellibrachia satsuma]